MFIVPFLMTQMKLSQDVPLKSGRGFGKINIIFV